MMRPCRSGGDSYPYGGFQHYRGVLPTAVAFWLAGVAGATPRNAPSTPPSARPLWPRAAGNGLLRPDRQQASDDGATTDGHSASKGAARHRSRLRLLRRSPGRTLNPVDGLKAAIAAYDPESKAARALLEPSPRLFFLFLTRNGMDRPDLWERFLRGSGDPTSQYRAFVHCTDKSSCLAQKLPWATVVDSVPSVYCEDLVSPMVQLLKSAMTESTSNRDKFLWLSESTLPVKPFNLVYKALTANSDSEFCVHPEPQWPVLERGASPEPEEPRLLKHSQWSVLSRDHANIVIHNWPQIKGMAKKDPLTGLLNWSVPLLRNDTEEVLNTGKLSKRACADEWAVFASIYGAVNHSSLAQYPLGKGLQQGQTLPSAPGARNNCRTFTYWSLDTCPKDTMNLVQDLDKDWPRTRLSCDKGLPSFGNDFSCHSSHPVEFRDLSDKGAHLLRVSPFLFARKFGKYVMSQKQYDTFILFSRA